MLAKRIIPCLDVKDNLVVKGVKFKEHEIMGDIITFVNKYKDADELVFYDITASAENRTVDKKWILEIAKNINIPFCVAGGIRTIEDAKLILNSGADKISINSPAIENPNLITGLSNIFGVQCVVVGIDSKLEDGEYYVYQYTGSEKTIKFTKKKTIDWVKEVEDRGAGEIVLNCMNSDGMRNGYDIEQLNLILNSVSIPVIASGGAGSAEDFVNVFKKTNVSGALAASVFHKNILQIKELKNILLKNNIRVRI